LENLLSIFDQSYKTTDIHILNIDETNMPEQFKVILRKLQQAMADTKVRMTMTAEDDILDELGEKEREISDLEENVAGKDKIIEEKDKILEENAKVLEAKEKELEAKEKALAAQVEAFKEQLREIEALKKKLSDSGMHN
jgi:chromosome segregation ATPase